MIVLGIDPGTATTGYGLIRVEGKYVYPLEFDLIETNKAFDAAERLNTIYTKMNFLLDKAKPDVMAIEKVFFATNAKTAIRVGQAQGVMLLSAASFGVPVFEYAPGTIKKIVSGSGRADKKQMQQALRGLFGPRIRSKAKKKTHFDDAADALAVAVCHIVKCGEIEVSYDDLATA